MKTLLVKLLDQRGLMYIGTPKDMVLRPLQLPMEIYNKLTPEMQKLKYAADKVQKPIYFYPLSKDRTLMNFGPYTSVIMNDISEKELSDFLSKQVEKTYKVCNINK